MAIVGLFCLRCLFAPITSVWLVLRLYVDWFLLLLFLCGCLCVIMLVGLDLGLIVIAIQYLVFTEFCLFG